MHNHVLTFRSQGSHVAVDLFTRRGLRVRVADIEPHAYIDLPDGIEVYVGNLCDATFCRTVMQGVDFVLHFAANMGGMGTIHDRNGFTIYRENHLMTLLLLETATSNHVQRFLYASSACVYPHDLQTSTADVYLDEDSVAKHYPSQPQGLYGQEKLSSEHLILAASQFCEPKMHVRIARFHNIFGPGGAWDNGREKAPAALLRKVFAARHSNEALPISLEIWGDGEQRRSFLFINDATEAIWLLLNSKQDNLTVNIGSDCSVSIKELAVMALECAGYGDGDYTLDFLPSRPVGVASRNADLKRVLKELDWTWSTPLMTGMQRTGQWIEEQILKPLSDVTGGERNLYLQTLRKSIVIELDEEVVQFALLLPITSRGSKQQEDCLRNLGHFARSLIETTARDVGALGRTRFRFKVYLAIDRVDVFLQGLDGATDKATLVLRQAGILDTECIICDHPKGYVCRLWRDLARQAYERESDYYLLVGDDVVFRETDWMSKIHRAFADLATARNAPHGFGCVAFTDESFPGMPTFPVVHRLHMQIFQGDVIPNLFVNQDGDPFLYQLYRRFGASAMNPVRLTNRVGGLDDARYKKHFAAGWTYEALDNSTSTVGQWLYANSPNVARMTTIDVVIPCYRVRLDILEAILTLDHSQECTVMFVIIIDDPTSPNISQLLARYGARPDVRIRVNSTNLGASASRNRGLQESAAEWVHFLDDDIVPDSRLLFEAEAIIREHPDAAGFVGNTQFPVATGVFTTAVHIASVTWFWDIATKMPALGTDLPWGVTANLIVRRRNDGVQFDLSFPKTGGGEDIDYCLKKRELSLAGGGGGFYAAPRVLVTHPWWSDGKRSYKRFYLWAKGDGGLIRKYPTLTYTDFSPNSAESLMLAGGVIIVGYAIFSLVGDPSTMRHGVHACISVLAAHIVHDAYRHLARDRKRLATMKTTVRGPRWILAVLESTFIRIWSEVGRLVGLAHRGELGHVGRRFEWFAMRAGEGPRQEERRNGFQRLSIAVFLFAVLCCM